MTTQALVDSPLVFVDDARVLVDAQTFDEGGYPGGTSEYRHQPRYSISARDDFLGKTIRRSDVRRQRGN